MNAEHVQVVVRGTLDGRRILECGDRSRRFAVRQPQLPRLRSRQGKAATAVAALQMPTTYS